ncbi:MAG: hypothetical protein LBU47_07075 [Christensenellaceae bacterium]|jgi:hypothetical protein|nr:hypothetical protein [Christensenellaceae bacterium]
MRRAEDLRDLRFHKGEVLRLFHQEKLFVLPPPYARGLFRVKSAGALPPRDCLYAAELRGYSAFVGFTQALWLAAARAQWEGPRAEIEPSLSPLHTALYQSLRLEPEDESLNDEMRFLIRAALEVPALLDKREESGSAEAAKRLLSLARPRVCAALARALQARKAQLALLGPARAFAALLDGYGDLKIT